MKSYIASNWLPYKRMSFTAEQIILVTQAQWHHMVTKVSINKISIKTLSIIDKDGLEKDLKNI